jgi:hypothetical protein
MYTLFLYTVVFVVVMKNNISFIKKYTILSRGVKQKGYVTRLKKREKYFSSMIKIPVFKYVYLMKEYEGEPVYSQWLYFIKIKERSEINLFIDKQNPNRFIVANKKELYICLFTSILLIGGFIYYLLEAINI